MTRHFKVIRTLVLDVQVADDKVETVQRLAALASPGRWEDLGDEIIEVDG